MRLCLVYLVFFLSGFAALVYQIVWQRALVALYGVDVESVTVIVTAFLLGLGVGSLLGGQISKNPRVSPLLLFGLFELVIGVFGVASLRLFDLVASFSAGRSFVVTFFSTFLLVFIPTTMMGATLPLLSAYAVRCLKNVGRSVGMLYCVNTLGSAIASWYTAVELLGRWGQQNTVLLAASLNGLVGLIMLWHHRRGRARV